MWDQFLLKIIGASGGTVLAWWVWSFMTGKLVSRWLFDKKDEDARRWEQRAHEMERLARETLERHLRLLHELAKLPPHLLPEPVLETLAEPPPQLVPPVPSDTPAPSTVTTTEASP